jgi:hypothetical protein
VSSKIDTFFGDVFPSLILFFIIGPIGFTWFAFCNEYESLSYDVIAGVACRNTDFSNGVYSIIRLPWV